MVSELLNEEEERRLRSAATGEVASSGKGRRGLPPGGTRLRSEATAGEGGGAPGGGGPGPRGCGGAGARLYGRRAACRYGCGASESAFANGGGCGVVS